jgi:hypothetical protein
VLPKLADTATADFEFVESTSIDLPALQGHVLQVYNCAMLTTVRAAGPRTLDIRTVPGLETVALHADAATEFAELDGVNALQTLDFLSDAHHLIGLAVRGAATLRSVAGAAQPTLADLTITDTPMLTSLGAVGGSAITGELDLQRTGLTAISMPNVVDLTVDMPGALAIRSNAALTTLALPNLTKLGARDHFITDNPMLPTAQATAIRARVTLAPGGTFTIKNNLP